MFLHVFLCSNRRFFVDFICSVKRLMCLNLFPKIEMFTRINISSTVNQVSEIDLKLHTPWSGISLQPKLKRLLIYMC